jgi:Uma2 family endonuclease
MTATLSLQDVLEMPLERREFLGRDLTVPPAPEIIHQKVSGKLYFAIAQHLQEHPLGEVFFAPLDVILLEQATQPDIVFVATSQADIIKEKYILGAPTWIIEVVSPTSHKRDLKPKSSITSRVAYKNTGLFRSRVG